jgi:hypothetical protein
MNVEASPRNAYVRNPQHEAAGRQAPSDRQVMPDFTRSRAGIFGLLLGDSGRACVEFSQPRDCCTALVRCRHQADLQWRDDDGRYRPFDATLSRHDAPAGSGSASTLIKTESDQCGRPMASRNFSSNSSVVLAVHTSRHGPSVIDAYFDSIQNLMPVLPHIDAPFAKLNIRWIRSGMTLD